jgi:hypothetical protein
MTFRLRSDDPLRGDKLAPMIFFHRRTSNLGGMLMTRHLQLVVAALLAFGSPQMSPAALLSVDINSRSGGESGTPDNTPPGFESWVINTPSGGVTTAVQTLASGYTVQFDVFDDGDANDGGAAGNQAGAFDDRDRVSPTGTPTANEIYDDFIFAGASAGPTGGLDMSISGGALQPNTQYLVSLYSFDGISSSGGSSVPNRTADWFDGNNADALAFTVNFATNVHPTTDDQYKFTGVATTDATGKLFLKGRRVTAVEIANDLAVYVDGIIVDQVPEPASLIILGIGIAAASLRRFRR